MAALSISLGPRWSPHPLICFRLADLDQAMEGKTSTIPYFLSSKVAADEVWVDLGDQGPAVKEGALRLEPVDYGPNARRDVFQGPDFGRCRFGFTVNRSGWSSFPPHRFELQGVPSGFRELFWFRIRRVSEFASQPAAGIIWQGVGRMIVVYDGMGWRVQPGLHAVIAAPGCELGYLWAYLSPEPIRKEIRGGRYVDG